MRKKLFQNVLYRFFFLWVGFFELAFIGLFLKGEMELLMFFSSQLVLGVIFLIIRETWSSIVVLELSEEQISFYTMNNKVIIYRREEVIFVKERNIHLGGFLFKFRDGNVIKSNNRVIKPVIIIDGIIENEGFLKHYFGSKYIKSRFSIEY